MAYLKGDPPFEDKRPCPFPAFLLCDYDLTISQGPQLVTAVRAIPSCATLPIIIFSGSDDQRCIIRSYLAGADHYLCKPASTPRLDTLVRCLYHCAMLTPKTFQTLRGLKEYHPHPQSTSLIPPSSFLSL